MSHEITQTKQPQGAIPPGQTAPHAADVVVNAPVKGRFGVEINTDREIWRERECDYYSDSIHITELGAVGINCGGYIIVKPIREWHRLAKTMETGAQPTTAAGRKPEDLKDEP